MSGTAAVQNAAKVPNESTYQVIKFPQTARHRLDVIYKGTIYTAVYSDIVASDISAYRLQTCGSSIGFGTCCLSSV